MKGLTTVLKEFIEIQKQNNTPFNGFMAKKKFRSNMAEFSEEKTMNAYIDSGATHNFFYFRSSFICYERISEEPVKGAIGTSRIVGKSTVTIPIGFGISIEG